MSVTIADIMKLPSLREAKVVSGIGGLSKTISLITVLESDDPIITGGNPVYTNPAAANSFLRSYGSEIVITAFFNARNSIEHQCQAIRALHAGGEAALIIYYIGHVLPCLDKRVTEVAEELDFTIITMPENRLELRYSDVIWEVMEAVVKDRLNDTYFASEIIEKISHLSSTQRNINSVLSMLRDRVHCTMLVIDEKTKALNHVEWPRDGGLPIDKILDGCKKQNIKDNHIEKIKLAEKIFWVSKSLIDTDNGVNLYLLIIKETEGLTQDICKQSGDILKTYFNLWAENHGTIETRQLISAILNDEPEKMRRIAEILHANVAEFSVLMIFSLAHNSGEGRVHTDLTRGREIIKEFLAGGHTGSVVDLYKDNIVAFADKSDESQTVALEGLLAELEENGLCCKAGIFNSLVTTTDAKGAYDLYIAYKECAEIIYPNKSFLTYSEISFAKRCKNICDKGEDAIIDRRKLLKPLLGDEKKRELLETLTVYLLDGKSSVSQTAKIMFVHKNTIKYRINCLRKLLACDVGVMPETYDLYIATALGRLMTITK